MVLVTATAFGDEGPYSSRIGLDGTIQAMSGAIALSGKPGELMRCWVPSIDFSTGSLLAMCVLAALLTRERTGLGQQVDGSLLNTGPLMGNRETVEARVLRIQRQPTGNRCQTSSPFDVLPTTDGYVMASVVGDRQFGAGANWSSPSGAVECRSPIFLWRCRIPQARSGDRRRLSVRMLMTSWLSWGTVLTVSQGSGL